MCTGKTRQLTKKGVVKMKKIYDIMKEDTAKQINALNLELLSLEAAKNVDKDTGEVTEFVKVGVEIAKGQGNFSRCQFSVKIPDTTKLKVTEKELEEAEYAVFFENFEISYIDVKGNVYFRALSYEVEKSE